MLDSHLDNPDILGKIWGNMITTRLKIHSGNTPEAVDWRKILPFRVGTRTYRNLSDVKQYLSGNEYFKDKYVRVVEREDIDKSGYDGHYDTLIDIYDRMEGMPGEGGHPEKKNVPIDMTMLDIRASYKKRRSKKKSKRSKKKSKRSKKRSKRSKKRSKNR